MEKDEIIDKLEDEREKFLEAIDGLSDEAMQEPGVVGEWSVKDILAHLNAWEAELVKLLWQAGQGLKPSTVHFSDMSVDERNAEWFEGGRARPLELALSDFIAVRKQTIRRVEGFNDRQLNDPAHFAWSKNYPLWEWIENDSYGHEAEHTAQIMEWRTREGK